MPYLRLLLGTISLLLSGYFSMLFVSQGTTGMDWVATLVFCVVMECSKALFAGDVLYYNAIGQQYKAGFAVLIIALLFVFSVLSATWFLMSHPLQDNLKLVYHTDRIALLLQAVDDKKAQLAQCPHNHVNSCINPRNAELTVIRAEYVQALANQQSLFATHANQTFWQQCANVLGTTHNTLQLVVALVRSLLLELLGLILIAQFSSSRHLESSNASASRTKRTVEDGSGLASTASASRTKQNVTDGSGLASTASSSRTKQNVTDGSVLASDQRTIACKSCGTVIKQKRINHFFCSDKCRKSAHNAKK